MNKFLRKYSFGILLTSLISCYPEGNPEEKPEQVDMPATRENTGGAPDEKSMLGQSAFHSPPDCRNGFGLCDIEMEQPGEADVASSLPHYQSTFYMSTEKDLVRIEFNAPIPHFGTTFKVSGTDTLKNQFGYEYVLPVAGDYETVAPGSEFPNGSVEIKVVKGPESSSYQ